LRNKYSQDLLEKETLRRIKFMYSATLILLSGKEFTVTDGFHLEVLTENERGSALCEIQDITHPNFVRFNGLRFSLRKNRIQLVRLPKRNRIKISERMKERVRSKLV
jgi:hypothetical protein